jgi:trehalose 6-phosphate synthase
VGDSRWIAAAVSDADRVAAEVDGGRVTADGMAVRLVSLDAERFRLAYDVVANATLWFVHHGLYDLARRPRFDRHWRPAWEAYREMNERFATVIGEEAPANSAVLVQDYHLSLVAPMLRDLRPDVRIVHFSHTPFAGPEGISILPVAEREELMDAMSGFHACGFHTERWAKWFRASCDDVGVATPPTFVAPLGTDADSLRALAFSAGTDTAITEFEAVAGDRATIVRVDRMELSKNILRGFLAFETLLEDRPDLRERVVFVAYCYPSREGLIEYSAYRQELSGVVDRINDRFGQAGWTPIHLDIRNDIQRAMAGLRRADVILVNPIRDGMNLVAVEGPLVSEVDGILVLSREAGAWASYDGVALGVHPYDVADTAAQLAVALDLGTDERAALASAQRRVASGRTPAMWLADQLAAADA